MFPSAAVVYPLGAPYFTNALYNGSVGEAPQLVDAFTRWGSTGGLFFVLVYVASLCYLVADYLDSQQQKRRDASSPIGSPIANNKEDSVSFEQQLLSMRSSIQSSASLLPANLPQQQAVYSLDTLKRAHGVQHIAVIMDGNRRFGKMKAAAVATALTPLPKRKTEASTAQSPKSSSSEHAFQASKADSFVTRSKVYRNALSLLKSIGMGEKVIGHKAGGEKLLDFARYCISFNIPILTVYAFSTENWGRPQEEIDILMALFAFFFEQMREEAHKHGIYCRFIVSDAGKLNPEILTLMKDIERDTRRIKNRKITVNVCVSYGSRLEIATACQSLAAEGKDITEESLASRLLTSLTEDEISERSSGEEKALEALRAHNPDILFRTSGESRISNFLLYQCAYSEMIFSEKAWPSIEESDLEAVLVEYCCRNRRFGK